MSDREPPEEDEEPGAPLYMLSFGDMMTNLLCFFILLCAFAEERRVGFITDGVRSVKSALTSAGLPGVLPADRQPLDIGADQVLFRPAPSIQPKLLLEDDGSLTDRNRDALREVIASALASEGPATIPTPIIFRPKTARLSPKHQRALREIATSLAGGDYRIRIEGFTWQDGLPSREAAWELALERGRNVINYMQRVGDIPRERFVLIGRGPVEGTRTRDLTESQKTWGHRIVLVTILSS